MKTSTHRKLGRKILPGLHPKKLDEINTWMDNAPESRPEPPKEFATPGLPPKGHRRRGHDLVTPLAKGYSIDGARGVAAAALHLSMDATREIVKKRYGTVAADGMEAGINLALELLESSTKKRRNKKPRKGN